MIKQLVVVLLTCLLWGMGNTANADDMSGIRIWEKSSTEGFPDFLIGIQQNQGWVVDGQITRYAIGWMVFDHLSNSGQLNNLPEQYRNPEEIGLIMFKQHGLVDDYDVTLETVSPEKFMEIGQGKTSTGGWWLPTESNIRVLEKATVQLNTTANYIAEKQRQLAENGNWDISVRPAENLLNIIEQEAGDVESVAVAIATLREEIQAIKERTFTPEMNKALDVRFGKQMATLRSEFDKKLNELYDDTNKKFAKVDGEIVALSDGQEKLKGQQETLATKFDETNQANTVRFDELSKVDKSLGEQFAGLDKALNGLATDNGWKINLLFTLVVLCLAGIVWILWSQRSEKRKKNNGLSLVSDSQSDKVVSHSFENISEKELFDVRRAVGQR